MFKLKDHTKLILSGAIAFLLRYLFSFFPSFTVDMNTWLAWGERITNLGPGSFYSPQVWTHYTPGYLYWLWFGGATHLLNESFIKIPTAIADISVGLTIYFLIQKVWSKQAALVAFLIYVLNPASIFNGSVWGQIDGVFALFLFFSIYFILEKKNIFLSSLLWAIAFLIKPQALGLLPAITFILYKNFEMRKIVYWGFVAVSSFLILSIPFFLGNPLGMITLVKEMAQDYPYTSLFAYNFWSLVGMWKLDTQTFLGVTYATWGVVLYLIGLWFSFISCYPFDKKSKLYLFVGLSFFCFFLFPTRVHERYLFPAFPFLLTGAFLSKSRTLIFITLGLMVIHFLNLYYPYSYYTPESFLVSDLLKDSIGNYSNILSLITLGIFILFILFPFLPKKKFKYQSFLINKKEEKIRTSSNTKTYLSFILAFAFFCRIFYLWSPSTFYFDEVYHAFTAKEIVQGNPHAWEYTATPPQGFAYEWTHPPLAKLFMAGSISLFGESAFVWRLPGALLGTGCVFLIFLLGKRIFRDERVGLLAAFLFSLDGLMLVMSRIGMNDIYFLFFALLAIYLYLRDYYFFSSIAWGLSLSSKWTSIFLVFIFAAIWLLYKRNFSFKYLLFLIVPPALYLGSYSIFFLTGHTLEDFWHTQQQMWWYHTQLVATHPYSSPWWSWPFMLKPVWLYTNTQDSLHQDIYIAGNPIIFITGFFALLLSGYSLTKRFNRALLFVIISYCAVFLPWARSPRIMFLYHYTPTIPFLVLALGWLLIRLWDSNQKVLVKTWMAVIILAFLLYLPFWIGYPIPQSWWEFHF